MKQNSNVRSNQVLLWDPINLLKRFTKAEVEDYQGNQYWLEQYYYARNEYLQHEEDQQQQQQEGVMNDDFFNVQQNSDHAIPQASFSMSQQTPEIDKEEEVGKNSSTTFESVEESSLSSLSSNQQQQELLNNHNGCAKVEEDDNRYTSSRSSDAEDGEGAKNQDSLNVQHNNHNGVPQGSFSIPQQIPENGKGKGLLTYETTEVSSSSSSNQQQDVLSNQIRSTEAGVRGDQLVDKMMNVEPDTNLVKVKKVNELRPGTNGFSITVKLVDCKIIKNATSRRAECLVGDETAMVVLTAKKKNVDLFANLKPGTTIILHNAKVELFRFSMRLLVDEREPNDGQIEISTRPASFSVKEDNNMSLIAWEKLNLFEW